MASRIRDCDWSRTALGPSADWPVNLRTVVAMMTAAPNPMVLLWGTSGVLIYNDGYALFAGKRHPAILGRAHADAWPDIAAFNDEVMRRGLGGEAWSLRDQELTLDRGLGPERAWMDLDYVPVPDESGRPAGVIVFVTETTDRLLAERQAIELAKRQQVLLDLNDAIRDLTDPAEIAHASARMLAEALQVTRAGYGVMDVEAETITIERDFNAPEVTSIAGTLRFRDFGSYIEDLKRGETVAIADTVKDPRTRDTAVALAGIGVASFINMPLMEQGRVVALVFVNHVAPRSWSPADINLMREVAARVRIAAERARAAAALRENEARLRFLDDLGQATTGLTDADEIMAVTCRLTARHLAVSNCAYADMDPDQDGFSIRGDWAAPGVPHITGHYQLADFGRLAVEELGAGRPLIINDNLREIDPEEAAAFQAIGISATICMPLVKEGRLVALMAIHHAEPHRWTDAELSTIREVTARSWAHVERVAAQAALQESEGRQVFLLKLADALRPLTDPEAVVEVATRMIAERIDADRVGYAEDEPDDGMISVRADHVLDGPSLRGRYRYEDYGAELLARFRRGETVVRPDIVDDPGLTEAEKAAHAALGLGATINVPLLINGRLRAVMFAHWKQAHEISPNLAALIEGAAERVRSAFDRVTAEAARRVSEGRYQALFDAIDEGFCIIEFIDGPEGPLSDYIHVEANAAYTENAGIPDVVGQKVREMVPDEAQGWIDLYKGVLETGEPIRFEKELEATARWLELAAFRVEPKERNQVAVLFKDLTARKLAERGLEQMNLLLEERVEERTGELMAAEEALRQSQKMEAVGQLTGGIAHDFNNLLAGISGALELLSKRMAEGRTAGMERYIDAAQGSAQRAAALTQRLLAFSRRQTLDPRPTDVNRLIAGMEDLVRRSVGPTVQVEVVGAGGLWPVRIDQGQLENALLNLAINARDAMAPKGGRLTIETANKWLDERHAKDRDLAPGQYVSLCVSDTGTGMSPEIVERIFDPFFTTKPLGQGTGLGLSMIHGFVRQSGGQVRVYSEPGSGTTMCLYLPRFQGEVDAPGETADAEVAEGGHGETVLVVDDDETVRMLVTEVLREAGYRVIGAGDGPSGLDILRSDARIDLLITDVGLPGGMNGRQVADAARETRPDLKVLFITGYAENAAVGNGLLDVGMEVMTKPFVMSDLALKVHEMVEG